MEGPKNKSIEKYITRKETHGMESNAKPCQALMEANAVQRNEAES